MSKPTIAIRFYHVKDLRLDFLSMCYLVLIANVKYTKQKFYTFSSIILQKITFVTLLPYLCLHLKKRKSNNEIYEMVPGWCSSVC